jgi:hypothetical protein
VKAKLEEKIVAMRDWVEEMGEEAREATRKMNKAVKAEEKSRNLASMRLTKLIQLKHDLGDAHDSLANESKQRVALEEMSTVHLEIKREHLWGCRGGAGKWSAGVVLLICELLVNGTPPSAVPAILQSTSAHMIGSEVEQLPSVNFIRECRVVVKKLNEMLAAYKLGAAESCTQVFTDGTHRRQTALQNLAMAVKSGDNAIEHVIASSCIFAENKTSESIVDAIKAKVSC